MEKEKRAIDRLLTVCFIANILFFGMYYEFCGAIFTVILSCLLLILYRKRRNRLEVRISLGMALFILLFLGYAAAVFPAVDSGMAFLGLGKILWIGPFLLLYQQMEHKSREQIFYIIPWAGVFVTLFCLTVYFIPVFAQHFWVNGRLGGTFQYPNTYALFLLVGVIILLHEERLKWRGIAGFCVLCIGIGASGSRIVMVLSGITILVLILQKRHWIIGIAAIVLGIAAAAYILLTRDTASIGRIIRLSLKESTLIGRILYAQDAIPLLLRHPFGMGHLGYYYSENMVQTGVYTVRFIHNDCLQIGLDAGWVPMLGYIFSVICCMVSKDLSPCKKWILAIAFLHGLLDFDLTYTVMLFIVIMLMDDVRCVGKAAWLTGSYPVKKQWMTALAVICMGAGLYLSIPTVAEYNGNHALAVRIYPWYTDANLYLLSEQEDIGEVERLADRVLAQNDTCALAYYAKAFAAYCRDDYLEVIRYQKKAIDRDYFNYEEYANYAAMLYDGVISGTDEEVRKQCRRELMDIPAQLEAAKNRVSFLGSKIKDQPELELDEGMQDMLFRISDST